MSTDVIEEHHCRNCFPHAPNPQELGAVHQELPTSLARKQSQSPTDLLKPDPDVAEQASILVGELSGQPTKLRSYPFKFREIIERCRADSAVECILMLDYLLYYYLPLLPTYLLP